MMDIKTMIVCPACKGSFTGSDDEEWKCANCGYAVQKVGGVLVFNATPETIQPFEKTERGPEKGTIWRQANWSFLEQQIDSLDKNAVILDVGCGHGDFSKILSTRECIYLDIVPYPEAHLACDLTKTIPFRSESFDAIVLMNVLEHVFEAQQLLLTLKSLLKPGGVVIITIPFLLKIHHGPFDFQRYTHYALRKIADDLCLECVKLEGFYDAPYLVGEGVRNIQYYLLSGLPRIKRWLIKLILLNMNCMISALGFLLGSRKTSSPDAQTSQAPIGYHVVLRKMEPKGLS
jgi:SAM-dependent methyltransferase